MLSYANEKLRVPRINIRSKEKPISYHLSRKRTPSSVLTKIIRLSRELLA